MMDASRPHLPRLVRIADGIAVALVGCALAAAAIHGGIRLYVHGLRLLTVTSGVRPLIAAAVLILVRHVAYPHQNLWRRLVRGLGLHRDTGPPTASAQRRMCVSGLALLLLVLAGNAAPIITGDGAEYMTMALRFARLRSPALTTQEILGHQTAGVRDPGYSIALENTIEGADHRRDLVHFWLYSLLASPFVRLATEAGIHPNYGFLALNLLCLLAAAAVLVPRIGPWSTVVITTGPLVWWIDKAHTEIFVFSTLAAALALLPSAPGLSLLALGALSAQVPALAPVACLVFVWGAARVGTRGRGFWLGAAGGLAIAALHPLYYLMRLGVLSPLSNVVARQWPGWAVLTAVVWDPNIGLLANHPALTLALAGAAITLLLRAPRRLASADMLFMAFAWSAALLAFSQTTNFNHGGTPSISRYAVWAIPLTIPLLSLLHEVTVPRKAVWLPVLAALSVMWAIVVYPPRRADEYLAPTPLANWLWTRVPGLDNPLPEIFCERVEHGEAHWLPAVMAGCEKMLLVSEGGHVTWPGSCRSVAVPDQCRVTNAICYANRAGNGYSFVRAPWQPGFDWMTTGTPYRSRQ